MSYENIIHNHDVILCTLSTSASWSLINSKKEFDYIIVDESGQSTQINTLLAFKHRAKRVILIGDTKQLPATVNSITNVKNRYDISLFERL